MDIIMISCTDVSVGYGARTIIEHIGFTANPSEITILLGRNGCGKSTLMRALVGNLRHHGRIEIDGSELSELSPTERARRLSLMPQLMARPGISVRELVSFGRQPYAGFGGILSSRDHELVDKALSDAGISGLSEAPANRLSGGELQKAYLALVLAQDTPNLLLDEPCAHLDAAYERRIADFLRSAKAAGKTVLAVYHDLSRAVELADRLLVIDQGRLVFDGDPGRFISEDIATNYFGLQTYRCPDAAGERIFFR